MNFSFSNKATQQGGSQQGWVAHLTLLSVALSGLTGLRAADHTAEGIEFFETKIRPVLAQECYECHNSRDKAKGGLVLDFRDGLLEGGDLGPTIIPGKPDESILMEALRHEYDLEMPKAGVKLDPPIVANFEQWIAMGAPDPRDNPPSDEELASDTGWDAILETRKNWWSFQPVAPPAGAASVDSFIDEKLTEAGLAKSPAASPDIIARRLYFTITGLPPSPQQLDEFRAAAATDSEAAIKGLTTELLTSPAFGETWARHWMDWIRYAESHGSEGDPMINNAHLYRDYLIRALNSNIPYDQLLEEHIAGDLLENPRLNDELGINESIIATAHWRMVFHGFAPTDALDEKVRFTDDQINVFTKAFQGLTVSCARCHNHKFDAISQADYYALFGIFGSTRPGRKLIDRSDVLEKNKTELAKLKSEIRASLINDWSNVKVPAELPKWEKDFQAAQKNRAGNLKRRGSLKTSDVATRWDLRDEDEYSAWFKYGNGLPSKTSNAGEFTVAPTGDSAVSEILPSGVYSHLLSNKHAARLTSKEFTLDDEYELLVRTRGGGKAMVRYVVQNYPRSGTVFKVDEMGQKNDTSWKWHKFDLTYWKGDQIHIELATAKDAPLLTKDEDRSWFGVNEAILVKKGSADEFIKPTLPHWDPLFEIKEGTFRERFSTVLTKALKNWSEDKLTDSEALFLDWAVANQFLPNKIEALPESKPLILRYRELESAIKVPTRVHGLEESVASNQPLFDRGDHKKPLEAVPRRYLDAIDPTPFQSKESGRLELAEHLLDRENPFTRRVIVNRVWHHLFGQGLVPTTDNFGRMGDKPSHPELLDSLAVKFSDEFDWSLKKLIAYLVDTEAFQRSSTPSPEAKDEDPDNKLLSHFTVKRLEAEAVRDALLKVSGILDTSSFGAPVGGTIPRRSVYVNVIRNRMDPFLSVYDAPVPFSTTGTRSETNVPAQSLTMLNSPFVVNTAGAFASATSSGERDDRISRMWKSALAREITTPELTAARGFLSHLEKEGALLTQARAKLQSQLIAIQKEKRSILDPARKAIEAKRAAENGGKTTESKSFGETGAWDFAQGLKDLIGKNDLELVGSARLEDGSLVLDGKGFAKTKPLSQSVEAKTLHVKLTLDSLSQKAGGAMTIQDNNGGNFDAIVYAEKKNGHWLSGSSNHKRTKPFNGTVEKDADKT
ncbi:MAG: PSD1 and planctomycete cytochrome C domain-containing protein, partial [Verrucomicrobiales bacterium]|nr:PSD1 and planctomycete cytochrome C domain-containing protein [Verrucomicrobiales bacterium]